MLNSLLPIGPREARVLAIEDTKKAKDHLLGARIVAVISPLIMSSPALFNLYVHLHSTLGNAVGVTSVILGGLIGLAGVYEASNLRNALIATPTSTTTT
jgi:hypothetical protein